MSKNDDRIVDLQKKIQDKRHELGPTPVFSPITSCVLEYGGKTYNLHIQDHNTLVFLFCSLHSMLEAAYDLGFQDCLVISGFRVSDFIKDIEAKLAVINHKKQADELTQLESQLIKLLSDDKRTELKIAEIEKLI